jgi:hypothetical protein
MVLCKPHRVVSSLIHHLDAFDGASVDGRQGYAPLGPTEKLEDAELHFTKLRSARTILLAPSQIRVEVLGLSGASAKAR